MNDVPQINPMQLRDALLSECPPKILDVREPQELAISQLASALNMPLGDLPRRFGELDPKTEWVVVCRSGARSAHATAFLKAQGFVNVKNLVGGINAYAKAVDPSISVY